MSETRGQRPHPQSAAPSRRRFPPPRRLRSPPCCRSVSSSSLLARSRRELPAQIVGCEAGKISNAPHRSPRCPLRQPVAAFDLGAEGGLNSTHGGNCLLRLIRSLPAPQARRDRGGSRRCRRQGRAGGGELRRGQRVDGGGSRARRPAWRPRGGGDVPLRHHDAALRGEAERRDHRRRRAKCRPRCAPPISPVRYAPAFRAVSGGGRGERRRGARGRRDSDAGWPPPRAKAEQTNGDGAAAFVFGSTM